MHSGQIKRALRLREENGATKDKILHEPLSCRTLIISDVHLGSDECKASALVGLLNHVKPENIILNGDILDAWQFRMNGLHQAGRLFRSKPDIRTFTLAIQGLQQFAGTRRNITRIPQAHLDVVQKLFRLARAGSFVFYIPGNHDDFLRKYIQTPHHDLPEAKVDQLLNWTEAAAEATQSDVIRRGGHPQLGDALALFGEMAHMGRFIFLPHLVHQTEANGRVYVTHGDRFDYIVRSSFLLNRLGPKTRQQACVTLGKLGTHAREILFKTSRIVSRITPGFSLSDWVTNFKDGGDLALPEVAATFLRTENEILARRRENEPDWQKEPSLDAIACGHNHIPAIIDLGGGKYYLNSGDWLKNCTAIMEKDGALSLVTFDSDKGVVPFYPPENAPKIPQERMPGRYAVTARV